MILRRIAAGLLALFLIACVSLVILGLQDNLHSADVAVILGNKVNRNAEPSLMLKARLNHTVDLYRRGYFKVILVSGGYGREGYDEPVVMSHYLQQFGIPSAAIFEDNAGDTTWDTARNTARFLQDHHLHSVLIISQYFHVPRCRLAFAKFGIKPIYWSHAHFWNVRDLYSVPRELAGLLDYSLR